MITVQKIFADRRKDIDQHDLFIQHRRAVAIMRRKMQNVAGRNDPRLSVDIKLNPALDYERHLFMWMRVLGRHKKRIECEPADHHVLPDDHLPFYAGHSFDRRDR